MLQDKIEALNVSWLVEFVGTESGELCVLFFSFAFLFILIAVAVIRGNEGWGFNLFAVLMALLALGAIVLGIIVLVTPGSVAAAHYKSSVNSLVNERASEKYATTLDTPMSPNDLRDESRYARFPKKVVVLDDAADTSYQVSIGYDADGDLILRKLDGSELPKAKR